MNLHAINRAREEARYVSRTWSNTSSAPDIAYDYPVKKPERVSYWVHGKDGLLHKKTCTHEVWEIKKVKLLEENARKIAELEAKKGGPL